VQIDNPGRRLTTGDITAFESVAGAKLPPDYGQFLLQFNGGSPSPDTIDVPGAAGSPTDVQTFFGLGRDVASSNLDWNLAVMDERCPDYHLIPIACDSGGNLFCLNVEEGQATQIVYCELDVAEPVFHLVAPSFTQLLAALRPL